MTNPDAAATKQREEEEKNHLAALKGKTLAESSSSNPAYVASIKNHVPITLDINEGSNYTKWCELFLVTIGKYVLTTHVDGLGHGTI
jgi:hypothetical protein